MLFVAAVIITSKEYFASVKNNGKKGYISTVADIGGELTAVVVIRATIFSLLLFIQVTNSSQGIYQRC